MSCIGRVMPVLAEFGLHYLSWAVLAGVVKKDPVYD